MHTTSKKITHCKQNSSTMQTKLQHTANKTTAHCKQNSRTLQTKLQRTANKTPARCKQNYSPLQTKLWHAANKRTTRCKQNFRTLKTKLQHAANKTPAHCKQNSSTLQTKAKSTARAGWRKGLGPCLVTRVSRELRPLECFVFKGLVNSSQFLSPNVLWSCNVQRQQPERSKIFIFSGLSLSHRSNSEKLRRFTVCNIAADILIAFAGEFFKTFFFIISRGMSFWVWVFGVWVFVVWVFVIPKRRSRKLRLLEVNKKRV